MAIFGGRPGISDKFTKSPMISNVKNEYTGKQPYLKSEGPNKSSKYVTFEELNKNNGGNNMNIKQGWGVSGNTTMGAAKPQQTQQVASGVSGWSKPGVANNTGFTGVATGSSTTATTSASGANWGTASAPVNNTVNGNFDKSGPAKEAIKKLAGRLLEIVPKLSQDEFNELAKIYDFAEIKDEFIQRSGRQDTYLDPNTASQAANELNAVFLENNQKSADLGNSLNNIINSLNTGNCDQSAIYNFILSAVDMGAIPSTIQNDASKSHISKVVKMALNYRNGGTSYGASGANWGGNQQAQNNNFGSFGGWGTTSNNNQNNNFGGWGSSSGRSYGGNGNSWGGNNNNQGTGWNNNNNRNSSMSAWFDTPAQNNNNNNSSPWSNNNGNAWNNNNNNNAWNNNNNGNGGWNNNNNNSSPWSNNNGNVWNNNNSGNGGWNNNNNGSPWSNNVGNNNNGNNGAPWMTNKYVGNDNGGNGGYSAPWSNHNKPAGSVPVFF